MRDLIPYLKLFRKHAGMMSLGLLLSICTLLAGIGLLSLSGWFLTASAVAGLAIITREQFNYMTPAGAVRFFSIVRTASRWGDRVISHDATFRVLTTLRNAFWKKLTPLSIHQLRQWKQGELLNRLVADIDALDNLYLRLITPVVAALLVISALTLTLYLFDPQLAFFMGGSLLLIACVIPFIFYHLGKKPGQAVVLKQSLLRQTTTTYLANQAELLLCNSDKAYLNEVFAAEEALMEAQQHMTRINAFATSFMLALLTMIMCFMLWFSANGVGAHVQADPLSALMVFLALASFEAIQPLAGAFQYLSSTLTAAKRLNEVMNTSAVISFGNRTEYANSGALEIQNIEFSYPHQAKPVLSSLSLTIQPLQKVAILGATGCGKSTLLSLLTREWDADQGHIILDGSPLSDFSELALRNSMSVVSQRVHIFSATLADNLRIAKPNASDDELKELLNLVELNNLLENDELNDGLKQWIGEGGRSLSGGEQRRLSLARALLHNAPIMIFDEVTEGLDPATEQQIMRLILNLCQRKTVLMVTHRLTGLNQFDQIALMESGHFKEIDTHLSLMTNNEYYRHLFTSKEV